MVPLLDWTLTFYLLACGQVQGFLGKEAKELRLAVVGTHEKLGAAAIHQQFQKVFNLLKTNIAVPVHVTTSPGEKCKLWKQIWVQILILLQSKCVNMDNLFFTFSEP